MKDLVSVIIPCFQQGKFLKEAINSLKLQTHANWEALVIDDGSTDETKSVTEELLVDDSRIRYIYQENGGLSSARNTGLRHAKGKWIQFLDADDILEFEKFEQQVDFLNKNLNIDIIYSGSKYFHDALYSKQNKYTLSEEEEFDRFKIYWDSSEPTLSKLINQNIVPVCGPLIRFAKIKDINYFNTKLNSLEDWEFWINCAMQGISFHYEEFSKSRALIRVHSSSMSNNGVQMRQAQINLRLWLQQNLEDPDLKRINYLHLLHIIGNITENEGRYRYYKELLQATDTINHKILVIFSYFFDSGSTLNKSISKLISKEFQKKIARYIGRSD